MAVLKVSARDDTTLVLGADGLPYGTGTNGEGQLTGSDSVNKTTLTLLSGLPAGVKAVDVAMGYRHAVVVGTDGFAYGAGANADGQLTGLDENRISLGRLSGLPTGVKAVAAAASYNHTAVLGSNGSVYGTGNNDDGQLTGTDSEEKTTLTVMTGLPAGVRAKAVAAGDYQVLVLGTNGVAYGAGRNGNGQLTGAALDDKTTLTALTGLPTGVKAMAVAGGFDHSLVLGSNGVAYGAGTNENGQLTGVALDDKRTLSPLTGLPAGVRATAIAAGGYHSMVVGSNGVAYGAGSNDEGQLTGTDSDDKRTLSPLTGLPAGVRATAIAAGGYHSVVVGSNGVVYGTGDNGGGQLTRARGVDVVETLTPFTGQIVAASVAPRIVGSVRVGSTVRVALGTWAPQPTVISYQWMLNGQPIAGARGATYKVATRDWKKSLTVQVTGARPEAISGTSRSAGVTVFKGPLKFKAKTKPRITGTAKVGKKLKVTKTKKKNWAPKASKQSIQWLRNGAPIKGATKIRYRLKRADRGKRIAVRITARKSFYLDGVIRTKATKKIAKK